MYSTIIISLKDKYLDQIVNGEKGFEYRKSFLDKPCISYVYVSAPIKQIKAKLFLGQPIHDTLDNIRSILQKDQPSAEREAMSYLRGYDKKRKNGVAIPIHAIELFSAVSLQSIQQLPCNFEPSPSIIYLDKNPVLLNYLDNFSKENSIQNEKLDRTNEILRWKHQLNS